MTRINSPRDALFAPYQPSKSTVIFKNRHYTACAMKDGSLIVTKNGKQRGRRLIGGNAAYWIAAIKAAIDSNEAALLCRALFIS